MLAILLAAIGSVGAATGLMLWATGEIVIGNQDLMVSSGIVLMIGGVIVGAIGALWYKANEAKAAQQIDATAAHH